jgi:phenylacetate-CoA ligase
VTEEDNDAMIVDVEMKDMYIDDYSKLQALTREITRQLRDEILITPKVRLVPKNTLPKSEGKAVRVVDTRKKY